MDPHSQKEKCTYIGRTLYCLYLARESGPVLLDGEDPVDRCYQANFFLYIVRQDLFNANHVTYIKQ